MLKETRTETQYEPLLMSVVEQLREKGYDEIKADLPEYDKPAKLMRKDSSEYYIPDLTASKNGRKYYVEIAKKTEDRLKVIGKWKLLSTLSDMKNGRFTVFVPHGSMKFTNDIIKNYDITATIQKL